MLGAPMKTSDNPSDWNSVKTKIKSRFSKLTDDNIDSLKGSLDLLSDKLQSVYGYAKAKADSELESFKGSLHDLKAKIDTEPKKNIHETIPKRAS